MNKDESFCQAIRKSPEDDALRLVYADWLDERGDPRGQFIRVQCELAQLPDDSPLTALRREELEDRERRLLKGHWEEWAGPSLWPPARPARRSASSRTWWDWDR